VQFAGLKFEQGSIATDWTPAPEDKVNVSDMRKPANQVASIDEVNAKQDKLDYTPANAANVVDRNPDTGVVSEPTDFTKLTVEGGKSVATSDDLKSLEASAWRELTGYNDYLSYRFLYKINLDSKYLDIIIGATVKKDIDQDTGNILILDLATIISGISKIDSGFIFANNANGNIASISYADTKIYMQVLYGRNFSKNDIITLPGKNATFAQIYYTDLV